MRNYRSQEGRHLVSSFAAFSQDDNIKGWKVENQVEFVVKPKKRKSDKEEPWVKA